MRSDVRGEVRCLGNRREVSEDEVPVSRIEKQYRAKFIILGIEPLLASCYYLESNRANFILCFGF